MPHPGSSGPCIVVFPAAPGDAEALVALRIEAMRESLERIGRFDPLRARERFLAGFSPMHTRHIHVEGECVGFVVVKPQADALLLDHFYIRPVCHAQGIGSAVLAVVIEEARAMASGAWSRGSSTTTTSGRLQVPPRFDITQPHCHPCP